MLEVEGLQVYYGDAPALRGVSLGIDDGEFVAVAGSNGAGKTTLLRTIVGLNRPRSGTIRLQGKRIDGQPPFKVAEAGITYVPQDRGLFPWMTTSENLDMGSYLKHAREKREETLREVYEIFPVLKERENQMAGTLSGGEQQMLAIGRALMCRPKVLMLDEPSVGLAPFLVQKIFKNIKEIHMRGTTVLLVEQNVRAAFSFSNESYVLENGQIVLEGKGKDLLENELVRKSYLAL